MKAIGHGPIIAAGAERTTREDNKQVFMVYTKRINFVKAKDYGAKYFCAVLILLLRFSII